jgi:beta-galactosidase
MKKTTLLVMLLTVVFTTGLARAQPLREKVNFNLNWRYIQGEQTGAESPSFNDAAWTVVHLPHNFDEIGGQ